MTTQAEFEKMRDDLHAWMKDRENSPRTGYHDPPYTPPKRPERPLPTDSGQLLNTDEDTNPPEPCTMHYRMMFNPDTDESCAIPIACPARFCPECSHLRYAVQRDKNLYRVSQIAPKRLAFVTLTFPTPENLSPLPYMMDCNIEKWHRAIQNRVNHFHGSIRRLYKRDTRSKKYKDELTAWTRYVRRGFYCIEWTWDEQQIAPHIHIHMVLDCSYIPWQPFNQMIRRAFGEDGRHQLTRLRHPNAAASYLTKYMSKSSYSPHWSMMSDALKGHRLCGAWGFDAAGELTESRWIFLFSTRTFCSGGYEIMPLEYALRLVPDAIERWRENNPSANS